MNIQIGAHTSGCWLNFPPQFIFSHKEKMLRDSRSRNTQNFSISSLMTCKLKWYLTRMKEEKLLCCSLFSRCLFFGAARTCWSEPVLDWKAFLHRLWMGNWILSDEIVESFSATFYHRAPKAIKTFLSSLTHNNTCWSRKCRLVCCDARFVLRIWLLVSM